MGLTDGARTSAYHHVVVQRQGSRRFWCACRAPEGVRSDNLTDPAGDAVVAEFHDLVQRLWRGEELDLTTWHSSLLFSIWTGRGLVTDLDGHRGIVLLDVLNKVVCKMLASRVSELAEKHCAESETGYRRGRGCTDALVLMRRLFQEWRCSRPTRANGSNSLYVLFIDLTRAFDAVPRAFLWTLLQRKLGVPAHVVDLPKAIYTGMTTRVCGQRGQLSTSFQMSTGVRQGSIEGPVPFLLYFAVVLKVWRKRCDDALGPNHGVPWQSVIDGTLRLPTHLRRCASREHCFRDSVFADDTAIFATNWDDFCQMSELFHRTLSDMGGLLNAGKTEWLELHSFVGVPDIAPLPGTKILTIAGQHSKTAQFKYLGAVLGVDRTCGIDADVRRRVSLAHAVFSKLRHLWRARENSLKTKSRMLLSCVAAVLLYSSDTWSIQYPHHRLLHTTWMMFVRRAQRLKHSDMQTLRLDNDALLARLGVPSVFTLVARRTAQWLGHVARLPPHRPAHVALFGTIPGRTFPAASEIGAHCHRYGDADSCA